MWSLITVITKSDNRVAGVLLPNDEKKNYNFRGKKNDQAIKEKENLH